MQPQGSIGPRHQSVTSDDGGHQPISTKHRKRECMSCNTRAHWWHTLLCHSAWGSMSAKPWVVLNMELTSLTLFRSFREGNFTLYRESLFELIPYFFANNISYAHWLPIHLSDMMCLEKQHPYVAREFHQGNFVVHKSDRNFSAMSIDQAGPRTEQCSHQKWWRSHRCDGGPISSQKVDGGWTWNQSFSCQLWNSIRNQRCKEKQSSPGTNRDSSEVILWERQTAHNGNGGNG